MSDAPPEDVRRILEAIHARLFDEDTSATTVCQRCGLRNHNAHTRFKMALGLSIREYIERERINAAKGLLCKPGAFAYEVAYAVGYANPETFSRAFRRQVGCTPGQFRERRPRRVRRPARV